MKKLFNLHIPKTAGSSLNKEAFNWFSEEKVSTHLESNSLWSSSVFDVAAYDYLSGHIIYPSLKGKLDSNYKLSVILRKPDEHIISHLNWLRRLGDKGEEERLNNHSDQVKKIVAQIVSVDLSDSDALSKFFIWLEREQFFLFHNTQTTYLSGGNYVNAYHLRLALKNLNKFDYVGITERFDEFVVFLGYSLGVGVPSASVKENVNDAFYGLDIHNKDLRAVLQPFIQYDWILYEEARKIFVTQLHNWLIGIESNERYRFTSVNINAVRNIFNN